MGNLDRLADQLGRPRTGSPRPARLLAASRPLPVLGPARRRAAGRATSATSPPRCTRTCGCSTTAAACSPTGSSRPRAAGATALLAFVLPRYPRETLDALREARDAGLTVVAITDSPVSPAAEHADVVLPAAVGAAARLRPAHRPDGAGHGAAAGDLRRRARPTPSAGWRSSRRPPPAASCSSADRRSTEMTSPSAPPRHQPAPRRAGRRRPPCGC